MLKSMTAYGRASVSLTSGHYVIEIQSVNRKFLEVMVNLPLELSHFDIEIKQWLLPHLSRGQVNIKVSARFETSAPLIIVPNLPLARQLKKAWESIATDLGLDCEDFNLSMLAESSDIIRFEENIEEEETYRQALKQVFEEALQKFLHMKTQEGVALQSDIVQRLEKIRQELHHIEDKIPLATTKFREKLMARLEALLPGHVENEERILREIALFSEKIDIAEEITRFYCHLNHFEELIESPSHCIGKTLEFVLQELNREVNTIGNKSSNLEIARAVIDIKSELERIREQIQNVE